MPLPLHAFLVSYVAKLSCAAKQKKNENQAALVSILDEKNEIELRAASVAQAGHEARASLEHQLNEAVQAALIAEINSDSLRADLGRLSSRVTTTVIGDQMEDHGKLFPVAANGNAYAAGNTRASKPNDHNSSDTHDDAGREHPHRRQVSDRKTSSTPPSPSSLALLQSVEAQQTRGTVDGVERAVHRTEATLRWVSTETVDLRDELERVRAKEEEVLETMNTADRRISDLEQGRITHHGAVSNTAAFGTDNEDPGVSKRLELGKRPVAGVFPERCEAVDLESELRDGGDMASQQTSRRVEEDVCNLRRDVDQANEAEALATESRKAAEVRCDQLEAAISEAETRHSLFRERAESRLEVLKMAFEQEQEERGAEVSLCNMFPTQKCRLILLPMPSRGIRFYLYHLRVQLRIHGRLL